MNRIVLLAMMNVVVLTACPPPEPITDAGRKDGGTDGGSNSSAFTVTTLDSTAKETLGIAVAFDSAQERIGIAYFTPSGTETQTGVPDYDLKYMEWKQGSVVVQPQKVRLMQRLAGVTIAFHPTTGEPIIGYLGGNQGLVVGQSIYWFQSDAAYSTRVNGVWTETVLAVEGNEVLCNDPLSDRGFLVGLWPALTYDSAGKLYFAYRDGHDGQFGTQDWSASDVELWEGTPPPSMKRPLYCGGSNKVGNGGHMQMVMANGQPTLVYDQINSEAVGDGSNVVFQMRKTDGSWTQATPLLTIANTMLGPSLAWDSMEGYGIAVTDGNSNQLRYINSMNGTAWNDPDEVFGSGTGGWWPSLAMDPVNHEPAIAFYICSPASARTQCLPAEDELRVTQRIGPSWRDVVVDPEGGFLPKLGFFASGKRVVVYRHPTTGVIKLAVEK